MAHGPNQGQELNLADVETPGPRVDDLHISIEINENGLPVVGASFPARERVINFVVAVLASCLVAAVAVVLCRLVAAADHVTFGVAITAWGVVFACALLYLTDRKPFRRSRPTS
jgi:hypothetical protein